MKEKRLNPGLITFPIVEAGNIPLSNLAAILYSIFGKLYVITGNEGRLLFKRQNDEISIFKIRHKARTNLIARAVNYTFTQLRIAFVLLKLMKDVDAWIFFIGGEGLTLPMITAKLLRKDVIIVSAGSGLKDNKIFKDPLVGMLTVLYNISYHLSDRIILYSNVLIEEQGLQKYKQKIHIAHHHFIDFDKFRMRTQLNDRDNSVGYIGRLSEEKGILNFVKAIPDILKEGNEVNFLIGGDGLLRNEIERDLNERNLNGKVKLAGWISHDNLPRYLNELKLIVLPSYTEGLPNIMLEAMACGTPVLATPVGAIPNFIKDGETGFIMENNSPECIAKNVIRALNHPNLEQISKKAHDMVEKEFTYEKAVNRYREIFNKL